jgi:hypothetical protein
MTKTELRHALLSDEDLLDALIDILASDYRSHVLNVYQRIYTECQTLRDAKLCATKENNVEEKWKDPGDCLRQAEEWLRR